MHLTRLSVINFKNYEQAEFEFSSEVNCLVGRNGEGKTNVLDAIHYLSLCKSYFNPIDRHNIKHNEGMFMVQGTFEVDGKQDEIHCGVKKGQKKSFKRNKKDYTKLAEHIGRYPVVMITPYDNDLIIDGSEVRRKLLDSIISQYDKKYLDELIAYNKAVQQRNALLKQFADSRSFNEDAMEVWDQLLVTHGEYIHEQRTAFFKEFMPLFDSQFKIISGGVEEAGLRHKSQLEGTSLKNALKNNIKRDLQLGYTTQGVHKDDLIFEINGHAVKRFASQGQQKSFLIALKLAKYHFMKMKKGTRPILLLDDIFDKLDASRVAYLIEQVSGEEFGQVFITDTDDSRVPDLLTGKGADVKVFTIKAGKVADETRVERAIA